MGLIYGKMVKILPCKITVFYRELYGGGEVKISQFHRGVVYSHALESMSHVFFHKATADEKNVGHIGKKKE